MEVDGLYNGMGLAAIKHFYIMESMVESFFYGNESFFYYFFFYVKVSQEFIKNKITQI